MDYMTEVYKKGVVKQLLFNNFTHPKQVARKTVKSVKDLDRYLLYVVNDIGEVWAYSVKKSEGKSHLRPMALKRTILSKDETDLVFSGKSLKGVIHGR